MTIFINHVKFQDSGGYTMRPIKDPNSKFIKIRCPKCKNEQVIFGKAATNVECLVCGVTLAEAKGGKSKIKSRILEVLD